MTAAPVIWRQAVPGATGPDVRLAMDRADLVVEEHRAGLSKVRMRIPVKSCVDAQILAEPGLPGTALVRLVLEVRAGGQPPFSLSLWFPPRCRPFLQEVVEEICGARVRSDSSLPLIDVGHAPDGEDWVVFRPADDGDVVRRLDISSEGGGAR